MQIEVAAPFKRRVRRDAMICSDVKRVDRILAERGSGDEGVAVSIGSVNVSATTLHRTSFIGLSAPRFSTQRTSS